MLEIDFNLISLMEGGAYTITTLGGVSPLASSSNRTQSLDLKIMSRVLRHSANSFYQGVVIFLSNKKVLHFMKMD